MTVFRLLHLRRPHRVAVRSDLLRAGQDPRGHSLALTALLHGGPAPR